MTKIKVVSYIEVLGFDVRLKDAAHASRKPVTEICKEAGISSSYWYEIVNGKASCVGEDVTRRLQSVLLSDLGVTFD